MADKDKKKRKEQRRRPPRWVQSSMEFSLQRNCFVRIPLNRLRPINNTNNNSNSNSNSTSNKNIDHRDEKEEEEDVVYWPGIVIKDLSTFAPSIRDKMKNILLQHQIEELHNIVLEKEILAAATSQSISGIFLFGRIKFNTTTSSGDGKEQQQRQQQQQQRWQCSRDVFSRVVPYGDFSVYFSIQSNHIWETVDRVDGYVEAIRESIEFRKMCGIDHNICHNDAGSGSDAISSSTNIDSDSDSDSDSGNNNTEHVIVDRNNSKHNIRNCGEEGASVTPSTRRRSCSGEISNQTAKTSIIEEHEAKTNISNIQKNTKENNDCDAAKKYTCTANDITSQMIIEEVKKTVEGIIAEVDVDAKRHVGRNDTQQQVKVPPPRPQINREESQMMKARPLKNSPSYHHSRDDVVTHKDNMYTFTANQLSGLKHFGTVVTVYFSEKKLGLVIVEKSKVNNIKDNAAAAAADNNNADNNSTDTTPATACSINSDHNANDDGNCSNGVGGGVIVSRCTSEVLHEQICEGDEFLSIGSNNVQHSSVDDITQFIENTPRPLQIKLLRRKTEKICSRKQDNVTDANKGIKESKNLEQEKEGVKNYSNVDGKCFKDNMKKRSRGRPPKLKKEKIDNDIDTKKVKRSRGHPPQSDEEQKADQENEVAKETEANTINLSVKNISPTKIKRSSSNNSATNSLPQKPQEQQQSVNVNTGSTKPVYDKNDDDSMKDQKEGASCDSTKIKMKRSYTRTSPVGDKIVSPSKKMKEESSASEKKKKTPKKSVQQSSSTNEDFLYDIYRFQVLKRIPTFSQIKQTLEEAGHTFKDGSYVVPLKRGKVETFSSEDDYRDYLCRHGVTLKGVNDRDACREPKYMSLMAWVCYHRCEKLLGQNEVPAIYTISDIHSEWKQTLSKLGYHRSTGGKWRIPGKKIKEDDYTFIHRLAQEGVPRDLVEESNMSKHDHILLELHSSCPVRRLKHYTFFHTIK